MEVSVEAPGGLKRRMTVQIPPERVDKAVEEKLRKVGRNARISGFRPGKAPMKILYQRYGAQARHEVLEDLLQATYPEALDQVALHPVGQPHIEIDHDATDAGMEYTASFDVFPEVELTGLDQITVAEPEVAITDGDIDRTVQQLREQHKTFEEVERPAATGDQVTIDFEGTLDGKPFSGGSGEDVAVEIGSGRFMEAMEDGLKDHGVGDDFSVDIDFPDDYPSEELRGNKAQFQVTVKKVEAPVLPELDDEFLARLGIEEGGIDALREKVRGSLEKERDRAVRNRVKQQIMDGLLAANPIEVPDALVSREIEGLRQESMRRLPAEQRKPELARELMPDSLFEEAARRRASLGLLISEVIKLREIEVEQDRIDAMLAEMAADYEDPAEIVRLYRSNPQVMQGIEAMAMEEQVVDALLRDATVERKPQDFSSLMNPDADEQEA